MVGVNEIALSIVQPYDAFWCQFEVGNFSAPIAEDVVARLNSVSLCRHLLDTRKAGFAEYAPFERIMRDSDLAPTPGQGIGKIADPCRVDTHVAGEASKRHHQLRG